MVPLTSCIMYKEFDKCLESIFAMTLKIKLLHYGLACQINTPYLNDLSTIDTKLPLPAAKARDSPIVLKVIHEVTRTPGNE